MHWVVYDLPAGRDSLPEAVPTERRLEGGGVQGRNSFRRVGYGGPCPPSGTHRYYFLLYALDARLDLNPGASRPQLEEAMEGHVLARGELMGRYRRQ